MALFRRLSTAAPALALLVACSSVSGPAAVVEVNVAMRTFERIGAPPKATVPFTVTNRGSAAAFVARCGPSMMSALDRWDGERWVQRSGDMCITIHPMHPLELPSGASAATSRSVTEPGLYRLRVGVAAAPGADVDWSTISSRFEVR